jgi:hypothetical protein
VAPDPALLALYSEIGGGTLITLKRDGRPQASVVGHLFDPGVARAADLRDRRPGEDAQPAPRPAGELPGRAARPRRLRGRRGRRPAVPGGGRPHDDTVDDLVAYYRAVSGEHPDWDDYRRAMVADGRLLLRITLDHVYGWARP